MWHMKRKEQRPKRQEKLLKRQPPGHWKDKHVPRQHGLRLDPTEGQVFSSAHGEKTQRFFFHHGAVAFTQSSPPLVSAFPHLQLE